MSAVSGSAWQAIETIRAGIGSGDRLVPNTMSQEEADALAALGLLQNLADAADKAVTNWDAEGSVFAVQKHEQAMGELRSLIARCRAGADGKDDR